VLKFAVSRLFHTSSLNHLSLFFRLPFQSTIEYVSCTAWFLLTNLLFHFLFRTFFHVKWSMETHYRIFSDGITLSSASLTTTFLFITTIIYVMLAIKCRTRLNNHDFCAEIHGYIPYPPRHSFPFLCGLHFKMFGDSLPCYSDVFDPKPLYFIPSSVPTFLRIMISKFQYFLLMNRPLYNMSQYVV